MAPGFLYIIVAAYTLLLEGEGLKPRSSAWCAICSLTCLDPLAKHLPMVMPTHVHYNCVRITDGLWDVMTGLEAVEIALAAHGRTRANTGKASSWADSIANGVSGENAEADPANALVKEAVRRGTADNVTAIVVALTWL